MELNQQYDPWTDGWMLGKYEQHARFPAASEIDEWLEGFKVGCAEVAAFEQWPKLLAEYIGERRIGQKVVLSGTADAFYKAVIVSSDGNINIAAAKVGVSAWKFRLRLYTAGPSAIKLMR